MSAPRRRLRRASRRPLGLAMVFTAMFLSVMQLPGCASPQVRRYSLLSAEMATPDRPVAQAGQAGQASQGNLAGLPQRVRLESVRLPDAVMRSQIVQRSGSHRVDVLDYDRWAEPLEDAVTRVIATTLAKSLADASLPNTSDRGDRSGSGAITVMLPSDPIAAMATIRVAIELTQFDQLPGREARIAARWVVRGDESQLPLEGTLAFSEPAGTTVESLVQAQALALQRLAESLRQPIMTALSAVSKTVAVAR